MRGVVPGLLSLALAACASTSTSEGTKPEGRVFVIAALMDGHPSPTPAESAIREASSGHFANMERLKAAGDLLLAGPSAEVGGEFRGLFVFACETLEEAQALSASDPALALGLLRAELATLRTTAALEQLPRLNAQARERRLAQDPEAPMGGFVGRGYVLATCNRGRQAQRLLAPAIRDGVVLMHGMLGTPDGNTALFVLDVESAAAAESLLDEAGVLSGLGASWALDAWWATEAVAELPSVSRLD